MQILVGFGFNSNEHLEGQLVHEERIQSTATDKISTVTFQYLTLIPSRRLANPWLHQLQEGHWEVQPYFEERILNRKVTCSLSNQKKSGFCFNSHRCKRRMWTWNGYGVRGDTSTIRE